MKFTTSDNVELDYEYSPGKQNLVFIHGWIQEKSIWTEIIESFEDYGILTYDIRGHGRSQEPTRQEDYSMKRLAQDLKELLTEVHITHPILIGHSMGAMIALQYSLHNPVQKLVLLNAAARNPIEVSAHKFIKRTIELIETRKDNLQAMPFWTAKPLAAADCIRNIFSFNIVDQLHTIDAPTIIAYSDLDAITPKHYAQEICDNMKNAQLYNIANAGHNTPTSHTKEVISCIQKALQLSTHNLK